MRIIRLYTKEVLNENGLVLLKNNSYYYLSTVLRAKEQQKIILFDNSGNDYHGYIKSIKNKYYEIYIEKKIFYNKKNSNIEVAFSICKNPCSDLIVQKLTELGIESIQPVISKNSIFNQKKIDLQKKVTHWKNISISSSEQSERTYLPIIKDIVAYQDYIERCSYDQKIILNTRVKLMLSKVYDNLIPCALLVGPEGDFTEEEYNYAGKFNFLSVSLGDNILRVETAVIAAFSYIKILNSG